MGARARDRRDRRRPRHVPDRPADVPPDPRGGSRRRRPVHVPAVLNRRRGDPNRGRARGGRSPWMRAEARVRLDRAAHAYGDDDGRRRARAHRDRRARDRRRRGSDHRTGRSRASVRRRRRAIHDRSSQPERKLHLLQPRSARSLPSMVRRWSRASFPQTRKATWVQRSSSRCSTRAFGATTR